MDLKLVEPFVKSAQDVIKQMTDIDIEISGEPYNYEGDLNSYGVSSIINFSGKIKGRFVLDIDPVLAFKIAENLIGEYCDNAKDRMFLAAISEINNIIAGDANTSINNELLLSLRLAPPIVFSGNNVVISTIKMDSMVIDCKTSYGNMKLNVGFQGGVE